MSNIAVIGAGRVGGNLAAGFAKAGHDVILATRSGGKPEGWQGPSLRFAAIADAAASGEFIVNALPGDSSVAILAPHADALAGKVLLDVANATKRGAEGTPGGLSYPGSSLAEELQAALPATKVVKTLNTMLFPVMTDPAMVGGATVFLSADDDQAKAAVRQLLLDLGWPEASIEDLGGTASARGVETFILLVPAIVRTHGMKPFALAIAR